jgi:hypothetical protein
MKVIGQIFDVNSCEFTLEIFCLIAWNVFFGLDNIVVAELVETLVGAGDFLEADFTIATRSVIGFKIDLTRLNLSKLGGKIVEPLGSVDVVLRDLGDEHSLIR